MFLGVYMKNKTYKILVVFLLFSLQSFLYGEINYLNKKGMTVETRYSVPNGYKRVSVEKGSFAEFLRNQKLKPYGEKALYYNGKEKSSRGIYDSVFDVEIGNQDLHQCADAIMLLRAEYFYSKKELNMVFAYCGTLSLEKEMKLQSLDKMKIGDAFIKGGSPGHVVLIVDMAENDKGEKIFMLAQSYMPAQQTQILINPSDRNLGVWYSLKGKDVLITPEWDFSLNQLRTF